MSRRFSTYNCYNIVGFSDQMQEHIRIVRFKPDGRLVCVENVNRGRIWAHPEDVGDYDKCITLPGWENGYTDDDNPFIEVTYADLCAAGWSKYLTVQVQNFDFNETHIHTAEEDNDWITLTMWGGYIDGRYVIPSDNMRVNRFYLKIRKPIEAKITKIAHDLADDTKEDFVEFFSRFSGGKVVKVCSYSVGVRDLIFKITNSDDEKYLVHFSGNYALLDIDKTDWRLQNNEEEFGEMCSMTWHHITYKAYSETWDHEHCNLCFACIDVGDGAWVNEIPETAKTKYLCEKCMKDFDGRLINRKS